MQDKLIPTTVIGSYPQPAWLVDHAILKAKLVPRLRARDIWRVAEPYLEEAQNDATIIAIRDQERAGIDVITDGEMRRESYSNRFSSALAGLDSSNPYVHVVGGFEIPVPRVVGPIKRRGPVEVEDLRFLKRHTDRQVKITLPGPFTMAKQTYDEYYKDEEALALAFAEVLNAEARELETAGADVIQFDDPWLRNDPAGASRFAVKALDRALAGLRVTTAVHLCFGYGLVVSADKPKIYSFLSQLATSRVNQVSIEAAQPDLDLGVLQELAPKTIVLGVIDLGSNEIESAATLAARIERALPYVSPDRLIAAPDCGMKYLSRDAAFGKLRAMVQAAAIVRAKL